MRGFTIVVMLLHFGVDVLLLVGTDRLTEKAVPFGRLCLGGLVGAVYAMGCLLPGFAFLRGLHWRLVSLVLISGAAFGMDCDAWKPCGIFCLLAMALDGAAGAAGRGGFLPVLAGGGAVYALSRFAFPAGQQLIPVEIAGDGQTLHLLALCDTGNTLKDPVTGERVLVIGASAAGKLTGMCLEELRKPMDTICTGKWRGLRLIPYRSVGQPNGMLLAKRFPLVKIGSRSGSGIVAFAPQELGGRGYQALTGGTR